MRRGFAYVVSLVALLVAALRPPAAYAHPQTFTVSVGRNGFENMVNYTLTVEAGHPVTLTFTYADDDLADDNPHDLKVKGRGLELPVVRVSRDQPTATLTFTPEKTGVLRILCIVPCLGMENLVGGLIEVARPKPAGARTALSLDLSPRDDGAVLARTTLRTADGSPLSGVPVLFTLRTALGGDLVLSAPTTIENGSAVVKIPATGGARLSVTARFEGDDRFAPAEAAAEITAPGTAIVHRHGPLAAPTPPLALALVLLVVLGGVWTTYGFVVYQVVRIRRGT